MVDDGPDAATRAVAGAPRRALRRPRRARAGSTPRATPAIAATDAELLVFVDDDVEVRPGWLGALLGAAADAAPATSACSPGRSTPASRTTALRAVRPRGAADHVPGPRARRPRRRPRVGREHGGPPQRRWTASGRFDERRELYGDEQEWQARLRAAGGRIRYVAAAALDHRRAGDDARLRALCARRLPRAARPAGASTSSRARAPRRRGELRVLAGLRAARPALRLRQRPGHDRPQRRAPARRWPAAPPAARAAGATTTSSRARSGTVGGRRGRLLRARDALLDARDALSGRAPAPGAAPRAAAARGACSSLGVERPDVPGLMAQARAELRAHAATTSRSTSRPRRAPGKFENLNALLARARPGDVSTGCSSSTTTSRCRAASWTRFLHAPSAPGCALAQPAHRLHSHAAWAVTRRRAGSTRARDELRRDRPGHRVPPRRRSPRCCRSRRCGWAGDWTSHWGAVAARARLADRRRRRHADRPHPAPRRRRLPARGGRRRGARVPRRPPVRAPRRGPHARGVTHR